MKKKILCALLSALLLFACFAMPAGAADEAVLTLENAAQTCDYVIVSKAFTTPIRLTPATLTVNGEETAVWFLALVGVKEQVKNQVNVAKNTFAAAFNLSNPYFKLVKQVLQENVPAGAKLVIGGHSLGGMIAQKLRTDADLKDAYEILNVLTCGSPYIMVKDAEAEGALNRLADKNDAVPYLSPATLVCLWKQLDCHRADGGYVMDPDSAHCYSYSREDLWGGYDALGVEGGDAAISFSEADVMSFGDEG